MSNEQKHEIEHPERGTDDDRRMEYREQLETRFVMLPTAILLDRQAGKLTPQDIYFYCYLLAKQGPKDCLWWGYESLELLTGLTESVMKDAMKRLLSCGHVKRKRQRDGATRTYCQTLVTKDRKILVRGFKVADAIEESNTANISTATQNLPARSTFDRNASEFGSNVLKETGLN